jgi:hypothetical protein
MAKVSSRYDSRFVEYLKSIGGKWNPQTKAWTIPENRVAEVEAKARELGVQDFKVLREAASQPAEGAIRMNLSKDGRFVLISINLIAFAEDVKRMLEGKRRTVRFRILPLQRQ